MSQPNRGLLCKVPPHPAQARLSGRFCARSGQGTPRDDRCLQLKPWVSQLSAQTHNVKQHRSKVPGIDAIEFESGRAFPRHCHDQYGIGVVLSGAQRSWSGIGPVESSAGSVITVNPGEMHDGIPVAGCVRRWRMLYFRSVPAFRNPGASRVQEPKPARPQAGKGSFRACSGM